MQGHIHKRVHTSQDGRSTTTWYVVVDRGRDKSGRRRQKWHGGFRTRREAEAARAKLVNEINIGTYVPPNGLRLNAWAEQWLPMMRSQVKPSTWDSYARTLRLHVLPTLGNYTLQQITGNHLNTLYAQLLESGNHRGGGGLHPKSVRYAHSLIHKLLADAVNAGLVAVNVADRARPPRIKGTSKEMQFWDADQVRRFLNSVEGTRLQAIWHLAVLTGMRRGELLGLRWKDIDFSRARLSVRHTIVSIAYRVESSTPKNHQARVVDLDPGTIEQLLHHRERQAKEEHEWGRSYENRDLVFCQENGTPLHPDNFTQTFERAVARSGLPKIRLHDLRHTHATLALSAGVPVKVISERLGHESPAFTMKQYAHVIPGMQAEAAQQIAALIADAG